MGCLSSCEARQSEAGSAAEEAQPPSEPGPGSEGALPGGDGAGAAEAAEAAEGAQGEEVEPTVEDWWRRESGGDGDEGAAEGAEERYHHREISEHRKHHFDGKAVQLPVGVEYERPSAHVRASSKRPVEKMFRATVPEGAQPGMLMDVPTVYGYMQVRIPDGLSPGDELNVLRASGRVSESKDAPGMEAEEVGGGGGEGRADPQ